MSGALIQLVAQGVQDAYITNTDSDTSLFKMRFTRYTNFAKAPKYIGPINGLSGQTVVVPIQSHGDLINNMWIEGTDVLTQLADSVFSLFIGGQKIDSYDFGFSTDIWNVYMADSYSKSQMINNNISASNSRFFPLHFFFCDNWQYIPLIALQYHAVEIHITLGSSATDLKLYGNYIYLDTREREQMVQKPLEFMITQVQKIESDVQTETGDISIDLSAINHPVRSLFWGNVAVSKILPNDKFGFDSCDMYLNGTTVFEEMSSTFFHSVQGYYSTPYGLINMNQVHLTPQYTRFFTYNFCFDSSSYKPTGTCNFSRLDNAKLVIKGLDRGSNHTGKNIIVYAVNYNILKFDRGMAGVLFSN